MITDITLASLTEAKIGGTGVFDVLMEASKAHLDAQFLAGRIKGAEYATVYLGQLQSVMQTALAFVTERQKINLEAQLLEQQVILAQVQVQKANAEVELMGQQVLNAQQEVLLSQQKIIQIQEEIKLLPKQGQKIDAEIILAQQQGTNLELEGANIPKQGAQIDAQAELLRRQAENTALEADKIAAEVLQAQSQAEMAAQQVLNLQAEALNIPKQGEILDGQKAKLDAEILILPKQGLQIDAQTALVTQQEINAEQEKLNLVATACLLKAQYEATLQGTLKAAQETSLLAQKTVTEQAQTMGMAVDANSVIGRQNGLLLAQTDGFKRDAEQKAAKILIDTWNTRRMTDDATIAGQSADGGIDNGLGDGNIARAVTKLLGGVGA